MTEFDKWYNNIEKEYPLHQDKDGYNIGNIRALRVGWKAALEWAFKNGYCDGMGYRCDWADMIEQELKVI